MIITDRKKAFGAIMGKMDEDGRDHAASPDMLHEIAKDLIDSVKSGDVAGVASAFKAAFDHLESLPHEEADED